MAALWPIFSKAMTEAHPTAIPKSASTERRIAAKENGLDTSYVKTLASSKGRLAEPGMTWIRAEPLSGLFSESTLNLAKEVRGRLTDFFGVGKEVFEHILSPQLTQNTAYEGKANIEPTVRAQLDFISTLLDLKDKGLYYSLEKQDSFINNTLSKKQDQLV